jgi:gephyrin
MEQKKKATILIVSDAASRDPTFDRTAGELVPVLAMERKWETSIRIVPNIAFQIQQAVCDLTDGPNWQHLILISPTTGFAVKDNTTEVSGFSFIGYLVFVC